MWQLWKGYSIGNSLNVGIITGQCHRRWPVIMSTYYNCPRSGNLAFMTDFLLCYSYFSLGTARHVLYLFMNKKKNQIFPHILKQRKSVSRPLSHNITSKKCSMLDYILGSVCLLSWVQCILLSKHKVHYTAPRRHSTTLRKSVKARSDLLRLFLAARPTTKRLRLNARDCWHMLRQNAESDAAIKKHLLWQLQQTWLTTCYVETYRQKKFLIHDIIDTDIFDALEEEDLLLIAA